MSISLPGSTTENSTSYIKAIQVEFKANDGVFEYYDGETITEESLTGIIVGEGFMFKGTIGRPTKSKSHSYQSNVFGFDKFKQGDIRIHQFIRNGSDKTNSSMGSKTYEEWKKEGKRLHRAVFVLIGENLFQVNFWPVAIKPIGDFLRQNRDVPNYISQITLLRDEDGKPKMFTNDNGEFYIPTIIKGDKIAKEDENKIVEKITYIDSIVNEKEPINLPEQNIPQPKSHKASANNDIDIEDLPF